MSTTTPEGSVWYCPMFDQQMTVIGESGPKNEYIQVRYESGDEDQYKRKHWDFERCDT